MLGWNQSKTTCEQTKIQTLGKKMDSRAEAESKISVE